MQPGNAPIAIAAERAACRLLAFVSLTVVVAAGCNGEPSPQAIELLRKGYAAYSIRDDRQAVQVLDEFLRDNSGSTRADEAFYLRGLARKRQGDPAGAKSDLDLALSKTQNTSLRAKALLALGDLAYDAEDMDLADNLYRQALADIERGQPPSDHAHYRLGAVLQRQGRWREADAQLDRVIFYFGDTELGRLAARRTHCTAWAVQTGAFGDRARAESSAEGLRREGLPAECKAVLQDGQTLFVVRVGRFGTYAEAADQLKETRAHQQDAFLTTAR